MSTMATHHPIDPAIHAEIQQRLAAIEPRRDQARIYSHNVYSG